ncbi:MAG: hypothetical protein CVT63_05250 [Candidatus Anoxymicrobium japonicum]|uniref:Uncharacterized protein n=1 Tax=Candidatus Anoxymicrobium japonicum TaxID=2013648 RepID=A0A2N3G5S1_9ACTN|nr:MAG: hypothetical protein CVT63_05250 [Candidatus Anoxymicrobium japonicum]
MRTRRMRKVAAALLSVLMLTTLMVFIAPSGAGACGYGKWYLPEGYTGGNFDTYILAQNPNDCEAKIKVRFMTDTGVTEPVEYEMKPLSRLTIKVNDIKGLEDANVSTMVEQLEGSGIVVERAMYFTYEDGKAGGSDSIGANQTSNSWYLAEGYTGEGFDTYILVMNPNEQVAHIEAKFITRPTTSGTGGIEPNYIVKKYDIDPMRRLTIHVDEIPGLEDTEVSTEIFSVPAGAGEGETAPGVVAERSMYFNYLGVNGGHCSIGAPASSNHWYLPEGRTAGEYDTYVLVMNPNSTRTHIDASFMVPANNAGGGREMKPHDPPDSTPETEPVSNKIVRKEFILEPFERYTIAVDKIEGLESTDVATMIQSCAASTEEGAGGECGNPVVVERAMYFTRGNNGDGHNTIGATMKREYWLLAEGYTAEKFDTWVLVMNPNASDVKVRITYLKPEGEPIVKDYEVKGLSRLTIPVDEIPGLEATEVSSKIQVLGTVDGRGAACEYGIIAERAMYFEYNGIVGGHCSLGVGEY